MARAKAWADGVAALSVLSGMRLCAAALEAMSKSEEPLVKAVLFSGLVVNYARAFETTRHPKTQTARKFAISKLPPPFDRGLHNGLLVLRDKQVAHSGHDLNDFNLTFMSATTNMETPQPDGTVIRKRTRHIVGTRARASVACGIAARETAQKLAAHIDALQSEARQRLALAIIEHDVATLKRLTDESAEPPEWETLHTTHFKLEGSGIITAGEEDLAVSLAKAPENVPLSFAVVHYHVVEKDGAFTLKELTLAN